MAVPYIYSPGTIIYSSEMNTNLDYVDFHEIANNTKAQWYNSTGALSAYIYQKSDNAVYMVNPDGDINATSTGYFNLRAATKLRLYSPAETVNTYFAQGSNLEIIPSSGNIHIYNSGYNVRFRIFGSSGGAKFGDLYDDNTNFIIASGAGEIRLTPATTLRMNPTNDIVMTPGGNVYITAGSILYLRNPADSQASALYTDSSSNLIIDAATGGSIYAYDDILPNTTQSLGSSGHPWNVITVGSVNSNTFSSGTGTMTFSLTTNGYFDFDVSSANQAILIPVISGSPASLTNGQIWYDTATGDFKGRKGGATKTFTLT